jgi:hypothetical protein
MYPHYMITIRICMVIAVIKYSFYSLSSYEVMGVLDYNLSLYARLNNAIVTIWKLK